MKRRIIALLLALSCALLLAACQTAAEKEAREEAEAQRREEERQQAIAEIGELNRRRAAQRRRVQESNLFTSAERYVLDALIAITPEGEYTVTLNVSGYIDATDEALSASVDTPEAARVFFDTTDRLLIEGNWRDFYDAPDELLTALMARGVSGGLDWTFGGPVYTFDAAAGAWQWHPTEGY